MNTQLATEISEGCIFSGLPCVSFTEEAADNMLPAAAAAEEPGEGELLQDRTQEACWSCGRLTYPWSCLPEVGKELLWLGSCTERSNHCCEINPQVTFRSTNSGIYHFNTSSRERWLVGNMILLVVIKFGFLKECFHSNNTLVWKSVFPLPDFLCICHT